MSWNFEFRKDTIEAIPLPDAAIDVVISNRVTNLPVDKPTVLAEMFRALVTGWQGDLVKLGLTSRMQLAEEAARNS